MGDEDSTFTECLGFRKGMVVASLNINSLLRHHDELSNFLFEKGFHVLALNETKLDSKISKDLLKIENYKIERCDRNREGGGIALYIKDGIKYHVSKDLPEKSLELLCIEVEPLKARPFFVISWYRPPSDTVETFDKLDRTLQFLETEGKELILLGDTNCDFLKFSRTSDMSCLNNPSKHMQQIYSTYELKQLINKPTTETSQQSTLIDHTATSHINNIVSSGVLEISLSDHYLVYCVRKFRGALKTKHKVVTTHQMKKFNESAFLQDLALIDWSLILQNGTDLNEQVRNWCKMLSMIIEKHAPPRKREVTERYTPWYTSELSKLSKVRDKIKKAEVKNQSDLLFAAYKQI